ncbi:MAG: DNA polymerase III subunit chi [Gammaproteobacteria bacterium]|nr:DNA polymerase III subunit chi [Gammaproteobacteria bacterium]
MTKIDFYVVEDQAEMARWRIAGRLAEKAYHLGHTVHVHAANPEQATRLDQFLWTFRDGSFLPHARIGDTAVNPPDTAVPVMVGAGEEPLPDTQILINLGDDVPGFFSRIDRVMEIVGGNDKTRAAARARFKFYRDRGYDLTSHKL